MASWTLLLLALALLGSPDLASSSLTPECSVPAVANSGDGELLGQGPAQEDPQGTLPTARKEQGLITCCLCQKIIKNLQKIVGDQPNEDTIAQAVSRVCSKMKLLRGLCKKTMRKFFGRISRDIIAGKTPHAVCVDITICKSRAGHPGVKSHLHLSSDV
ncbi:granulysin [Sturnira hondurensis]|uniref:granulysin n=1 Tax=Sturnira hondurensis TaxID=192404 RepID=UPI0018796A83|nr:granulysin [Sturnira hondurensis]XP_036895122.1 granulysin [Sturnira hondurensis]